jgi:hypothetical protein
MTMAMQAVKTVQGPKVLRIGVIQGGRIIEERIIRNRDTVSVGTTEKNTFTIVAPEFPAHFELFQMSGGTYKLNFTDAMEGRVAMPQGVQSLQQLKQSGQATRSSVGWQVTLNEQCRGKVSVGDVQFLFQFVAPPPPQPRPQLPAAIRAGWVKNIDWTYNACLAFFLVFAFSGIAYVEYLYDPEIEDNFAIDVRTVTLVTPPVVEEPPPEARQTEQQQGEQSAQAQQQAAQPTRRESAPATAEARARAAEAAAARASAAAERAAAAALSALQNSAEFAALTGATDTGRGSAADRLAAGGLMQGSVDALANTGGVSTATGGSGLRRTGVSASAGGLSGGALGASRTVGGTGGAIGSGGEVVVERTVRGRVDPGSGSEEGGEGTLDASRVAAVIRSQIGGIRSCYERALRNNPTLSGRLEVRFTIGTSGRVIGTPSTSGLSAAPEVGSCVAGRIRSLVFPPPTGGSVDFSFPFNFSPGG